MKLESLPVRAARSHEPPPQPRPFGPPVKQEPLKAGNSIVCQERRRAQRVMLRVRANIHVALQGKTATFNVTTVSVNGALVLIERSLPADTQLVLEHAHTRERVACRVSRAGREMPEGFQVPIEFDSPAPGFWKIAFPPADWRPVD